MNFDRGIHFDCRRLSRNLGAILTALSGRGFFSFPLPVSPRGPLPFSLKLHAKYLYFSHIYLPSNVNLKKPIGGKELLYYMFSPVICTK